MTQKAKVEVNQFVGGLITDASPLTYPDNMSFVDINMELNSDGSRQRSLGIDYEPNHQIIDSGFSSSSVSSIATKTYKWENVGGDPSLTFICVQIGNKVSFFNGGSVNLSTSLIGTKTFTSSPIDVKYSFTSVDGDLIIATGVADITTVTYNGTLSYTTDRIKVRDFWGVDDFDGSEDLTVGTGLQYRPTGLSNAHQYNLRNQGFGIPRMLGAPTDVPLFPNENLYDPIYAFRIRHNQVKSVSKSPSNSDNISGFLFSDASDSDDRNSRRYFVNDSIKNPIGNMRAAQGYYIIDLLNRGSSRLSENNKNQANYPELTYSITSLATDFTPGGATVICEFSGRVWYGGFSSAVTDGDSKSPNLASYVTFSQLVTDKSLITRCYQDGDPTSDDAPDIVDTDGGYIRISNAYDIKAMVNIGASLFVGASNGWWRIYGGNDSGFSATNYVVDKITDRGVRGGESVVEVDGTIMYWGDDGIYHIHQDKYGSWLSENITRQRIQKFYNDVETKHKENVVGVYDGSQRKVRWLYQNTIDDVIQQKELVLNVDLNAFYERHIGEVSSGQPPVVVSGFNVDAFKIAQISDTVTVSGVDVTVASDPVTVTLEQKVDTSSLFEINYLVVTSITPTIKYTFGYYRDITFTDWITSNGVGVDAPATLVTGTITGGDAMRYKQVPYLIVHMRRTEDGFEADVNGDFVPTNQSSCLIQSQWDWTNSANANKWGTPFQAYRYRRHYFPANIADPFDTGYEMVVTKNKLRGRGRAVAFKFTSSPKKEMHIYGWSFDVGVNDAA